MELFSRISGPDSAPVVVLLHGLFGASDNLSNLARSLSTSFKVHALDARNHGRSPHTEDMNYPEMAKDVVDYMDSHQLDAAHLFGHSMGGKTAMELALSRPDRVNKLIVADIAPVDYPPHHEKIFKAFDSIEIGDFSKRSDVEQNLADYIEDGAVRQFLLKSLIKNHNGEFAWRFNLESIRKDYQSILNAPPSTSSFEGDVLFIAGGLSDYILPEHREAILKRFPAAESKQINDVGHWLHAEKPELFNSICNRFLKRS